MLNLIPLLFRQQGAGPPQGGLGISERLDETGGLSLAAALCLRTILLRCR